MEFLLGFFSLEQLFESQRKQALSTGPTPLMRHNPFSRAKSFSADLLAGDKWLVKTNGRTEQAV
jgi:hypothetical protein